MNFLYIIDDVASVNTKVLTGVGLVGIIKAGSSSRSGVTGPSGRRGMLVGNGIPSGRFNYLPDEQTWAPALNGKFHIGYYNDDPPKPADLKRDKQIDGHFVEDNAGNKWLVPCARCFPTGTGLPQSLMLAQDGGVISEIIPRFIEFGKTAEDLWYDFMIDMGLIEGERKLWEADQLRIIAEALCLNYHIGRDEINALRIVGTENLTQLLGAIVDVQTFNAAMVKESQKKK